MMGDISLQSRVNNVLYALEELDKKVKELRKAVE